MHRKKGLTFALVCYGAQAAVNISVPIVAPIMMTLLMVGVSGSSDGREEADRGVETGRSLKKS